MPKMPMPIGRPAGLAKGNEERVGAFRRAFGVVEAEADGADELEIEWNMQILLQLLWIDK
jgi:hypothetical protein